jgi:hypothetical protein
MLNEDDTITIQLDNDSFKKNPNDFQKKSNLHEGVNENVRDVCISLSCRNKRATNCMRCPSCHSIQEKHLRKNKEKKMKMNVKTRSNQGSIIEELKAENKRLCDLLVRYERNFQF